MESSTPDQRRPSDGPGPTVANRAVYTSPLASQLPTTRGSPPLVTRLPYFCNRCLSSSPTTAVTLPPARDTTPESLGLARSTACRYILFPFASIHEPYPSMGM